MNDVDIKALPDDVATLKALILNQATELRYLQEQLNNWGRSKIIGVGVKIVGGEGGIRTHG